MQEKKTRVQQNKERSERMLEAALHLFCVKGIEDTSVEDVAKKAEVGPATVYRYFETKAEMAIQCGVLYWKKVSEHYLEILEAESYNEKSGIEQLTVIMNIFTEIFRREYSFLRFLYEFDIFIQKYEISKERLYEYEQGILNLKPYVTNALEKGEKDKTLLLPGPCEQVYFSLTHGILSLMQKFAANGNLLSSDEKVSQELQVEMGCEILLRGLKNQEDKRK